jgi:alanine-glyoxylate transaminase/serine-glyoxylate transaminase/serine-pyruvate transaminase
MHLKLMIPGPIELEDAVLEQMGQPIHAHYGDEWVAIHNETIGLLQKVFMTGGKVYMLPGSGSLGNDAAVQSLFAPGERVAVGLNGSFGIRMREILEANGVIPIPVEAAPGKPLDPAEFERVLAADPSIVAAVAVHLETSTAVLNPVREIAQVTHQHNRLFMVDGVSALAGTEFKMDEWNVDLCVSASQKGLGAAPGIAIVAVGPRAWERIASQPERSRSWYLDLRRWQWYVENWGNWHPFPVTMPTPTILGLRASLQTLIAEGLENRIKRYEALANRLRDGVEALGLTLFAPRSLMAPVLTAVNCPPGVVSSELVKYLIVEHHIQITTGFGPFRDSVFRVGHMGNALGDADIDALLAGLRRFLVERAPAANLSRP